MKKLIELRTGEKVLLRHAKKSDIEGVWENFNECVDEGVYLPVFMPVRSQYEKQSWYDNLKSNKETCIVAEHLDLKSPHNIIGQCEISNSEWEAASHVGILGVIVKNKYRDLGMGKYLIDFALRESKKLNNKEKIVLSCFSNNERAINLYETIGFKIVGIRKKQFYMDSMYYDEVLMELFTDEYVSNHPFQEDG